MCLTQSSNLTCETGVPFFSFYLFKENDYNWNAAIGNKALGASDQLLVLKGFYLSCQNYEQSCHEISPL